MRKKIKVLTISLVTLVMLLVVAVGTAVVYIMELNKVKLENSNFEVEINENTQMVYVASRDIEAGEKIDVNDNLMQQKIFTGLESEYYITEEDIGKTAIIDIKDKSPIMKSMVTSVDIAKDTREYEIQVCNLMVDQRENDYVDIRIEFPDGGDYLVLPKKQIKNLNLENCVFWTYLNEEEILRFSSAVIDAFSITGTKIYATRYVESNLQEEAKPTYLVNATIQSMMDPSSSYYDGNLMTKATQTLNAMARHNMEQKLQNLSEEKLAAVASGHEIEDTAKNSVIVGSLQYSYGEEGSAFNEYYYENELEETTEEETETSDETEEETETVETAEIE